MDRVGRLGLLGAVFGEVLLPPAVARELGPLWPQPWTMLRAPLDPFDRRVASAGLDAGEREAIALALEVGADPVLLDDRPARRLAARLALPTTGTIGVLQTAKHLGFLPLVRPTLEALLASGFRASPTLVQQALIDAGEAT